MAKPYSVDLRERVVDAVKAGATCRAVAAAFQVSVSSVVKWSQKSRRTGSVAPERMGGHRPWVLEGEREWLLARITEKPDLTLHALLGELKARDVRVCRDTLWRFLRREGISFKKNSVRLRTGPPGRGPQAGALEEVSGRA